MNATLPLVLITANRPRDVDASIRSYLRKERLPTKVVVVDDSHDVQTSEYIFDTVCRRARKASVPISYVDRAARIAIVRVLAGSGIPAAVAEFCLLGKASSWFTAGSARNTALVVLPATPFLMADDDTRGRVAGYGLRDEMDACLGGHDDPTHLRFFSSRSEAESKAQWVATDIFREISRWLGQRPGREFVVTNRSCPHIQQLAAEEKGIIRIVSIGTVGDSGFYSPAHLLWMASPETSAELLSSEEILRLALSSREVIRISPGMTVTHATVCMATAIGVDNRTLLPPFLPVGRNEDGFFGNLLARCAPEICTLHLPLAILHSAPEGRPYHRLPHQPQKIRLSELIIMLISGCRLCAGATTESAFRQLGEYLSSAAQSQRFECIAREAVQRSRRNLFEAIDQRRTANENLPRWWLARLNELQENVGRLIQSDDCWHPEELLGCSPTEVAQQTAKIARITGEMLKHWPTIIEISRECNSIFAGRRCN